MTDNEAIGAELGMRVFEPFARMAVGGMLHLQQRWEEALTQYRQGYALAERLGSRRALIQLAYSLGELYEEQGDDEQARRWFETALRHAERSAFPRELERVRGRRT